MSSRIELSGSEWTVTGWNRNQWKLGMSMELGFSINPMLPAIKAVVPGAVQRDLIAAGWLPDPNEGLRSMELEWVNNRDWVYERRFEVPDGWMQDRCELVFEGLDYRGLIYLNGEEITAFEGMFLPVTVDVATKLRVGSGNENILQLVFLPSPEVDGQIGYSNEISKVKSRFNYGWDWCPRIVPVGIWKDVSLQTHSALKLNDYYPKAVPAEDGDGGKVLYRLEAEIWRPGSYKLAYEVVDAAGDIVHSEKKIYELRRGGIHRIEHEMSIAAVRRWWPNGYGDHPLYQARVTVYDAEGRLCAADVKTVAFRTLQFVQNEDSPADALPYTLLVNGVRVFLNGVNWVPISPFFGGVTSEQYAHYLGRFKAMNVNVVRVWGGAITEKEDFYAYCDSHGLLVWQEFLQSSSGLNNCPPDNAAFLKELASVSRAAVIEKRSHPSLMAWCGGNELMWENFSPVDERHGNIAMLKKLVEELDPGRQFFPSSASGPRFGATEEEFGKGLHHDVHGPWLYLGEENHYRFFNHNDSLVQTETGTPGASRAERIRVLADRMSPWPPTKENAYWLHRGAWWIQWEQLSDMFGPWDKERDELEQYCQASRYLQLESLRYMAEATRRREPKSSGFMIWMGNEPFANNANTSMLEYDGMPKPVYYAMKKVFGGLHVSAQYDRLSYRTGESLGCEIFLHADRADQELVPFAVDVHLVQADGAVLQSQRFLAEGGRLNGTIGKLDWQVVDVPGSVLILRLAVCDEHNQQVATNEYLFTANAVCPLEPVRRLPEAAVRVRQGALPEQLVLANISETAAVGVFLIQRDASQLIHLDRNYLMLLPGEQLTVTSMEGPVTPEQFYVEGMNL
ncbi:glycoside hydrolase family 2 TIM barrel-domain containing protein [Paenibacillus sp. CF384]|uniref:glycoside hydrolase family 2 protein n=1 Tax=Paenibacillus sp. CF384 TaxID=1884382 RepID=UPI000897381A|nr:glycoside hydrolase family 2 TIM barrel-domain containing protein [Paenibacillus sp. CF384]SDX38406.1 beta-mannosidase [Paenibacillus sp. CF384]